MPLAALFALADLLLLVSLLALGRARRAACCRYSGARSCCSPRCRRRRSAAIRLGRVSRGSIFGVALGLMIATHARLQRALPARQKRVPTPPRPHQRAADDARIAGQNPARHGPRRSRGERSACRAVQSPRQASGCCRISARSCRMTLRRRAATDRISSDENSPSACKRRPPRRRPGRRRTPQRHGDAGSRPRDRSGDLRRAWRRLSCGVSVSGSRIRSRQKPLQLQRATRAVACSERQALRRGHRARSVAIPRLRRMEGAAKRARCRTTCTRTACSTRGSSRPIRSSI